MRVLDFIAEGQQLSRDPLCDFTGIAAGSRGYLQARFRFSKEWSGCKKVAVFLCRGTEYPVGLKDNQCIIPWEALPWGPYKETQALTITTPGRLPGIPVASGGNYTDANGKQWIADEVDLARGVYVQRVGTRSLTGAESYEDYIADNGAVTLYLSHKNNSDIICSHAVHGKGVYWANTSRVAFRVAHWGVTTLLDFKALVVECHNAGFPVTLRYVLANPVETALTDVELQAYLALHSNKPTTTVLNDAGAHMVLEYAADPKTYIDNKLAALVAANN